MTTEKPGVIRICWWCYHGSCASCKGGYAVGTDWRECDCAGADHNLRLKRNTET